jgi:hypothetical protein
VNARRAAGNGQTGENQGQTAAPLDDESAAWHSGG